MSVDPFGGRKLRTRQTIGGEREPEGGDQELLRDLKLKRNLEKFKGYKPGQENVMFVDTCEKVNDKIKHQTRVVVVTTEAIYNVEPGSFKVKRCAHPTHGSVASQGLVVTGEAADRSALGRRNFRVLPRRRLPVHAHPLRVQVSHAPRKHRICARPPHEAVGFVAATIYSSRHASLKWPCVSSKLLSYHFVLTWMIEKEVACSYRYQGSGEESGGVRKIDRVPCNCCGLRAVAGVRRDLKMSVANGFCYKMSKVKFSIVFVATDVGTLSRWARLMSHRLMPHRLFCRHIRQNLQVERVTILAPTRSRCRCSATWANRLRVSKDEPYSGPCTALNSAIFRHIQPYE